MHFDQNGFSLDQERLNFVAQKMNITIEEAEIRLRKIMKGLAQSLRKQGFDLPSDPQKEAELVYKLLVEVYMTD